MNGDLPPAQGARTQPKDRVPKPAEPSKVWKSASLVFGTFGVVLAVDVGAIAVLWLMQKDPPSGTPQFEALKTAFQVLGIVLIGAVIAAATGTLEEARRRRATYEADMRTWLASEDQRDREELANLERASDEEFEIRAALLGRTTRCAQGMYVTCQHVARRLADAQSHPDVIARDKQTAQAIALLHEEYRTFATEARALQIQIGARFPIREPENVAATPEAVSAGQSWWRWHQIYDLLTIYYFSLTGGFRAENHVLATNERGYEEQ